MTQLVVRQPSATAVQPPPPQAPLSDRLAEATHIARAGDLIPQAYRNNPGAVMLAMNWAETHGVDLFSTMGNVAFFGGKATVMADMQRDLAGRLGFFTRVTDESSEPGKEHCTVSVFDSAGELLGSYTFTHEMAKGLDAYKRNENYRKDIGEMLLARATTRALKRYASGPGLATIVSEPEDRQTAPVEVLEAAAAPKTTAGHEIFVQYGLAQDAEDATIAEMQARGMDPDALTDEQVAEISAWIEAQLEAAS